MIPGFDTLGQRWRQTRFNPLRSLTPERLTCAMDSAAAGWVREFALILEEIEKRDAIVRTVLGKRKAAAARQPWDVVLSKGEEENPEAQAHKETLEHFYNNLSVTDATDLNVRTGMAGLVRQMMDAVMQRYAVHEIVWKPTPEGMGAELRRVPLYFFENRTGRLRYIGPETRSDGMPLEEDGWMTTVADSVGEAISICYMFRRLSVQDWVAFSEKFSIPGVLGRTSHAKGTAAADAFRDSVAAFGSEWVGVFYNDDGTMKSPIEIIATAAGSTLPQKEMAEYMDRLITALVRGGDLGTLSRENSQGASLQGDETDAILADDCAMVSETLQTQLDPLVIRLVHGDVKPLAHVQIAPPADEDATREIGIDQALAGLGVRQSAADLAERYGREHVEEANLQSPISQSSSGQPAGNEAEEPDGMQDLRGALAEDLQPLGAALYGAYQAGDAAAMTAALKKISKQMPELAGDASALGEALALRMAEAFVGAGETAAENGGFNPMQWRNPLGKWEGSGGGGGTGTWKTYGLLPSAKVTAEPGRPKVRTYEAAARLYQGEVVTSDGGEQVEFTDEVIDHWKDKPRQERNARLSELDDAVAAVRQPREVWKKGGQTLYLRKYAGTGGEADRWMAVFVVVTGGKTRTYFSTERINKADELRAGTLMRSR